MTLKKVQKVQKNSMYGRFRRSCQGRTTVANELLERLHANSMYGKPTGGSIFARLPKMPKPLPGKIAGRRFYDNVARRAVVAKRTAMLAKTVAYYDDSSIIYYDLCSAYPDSMIRDFGVSEATRANQAIFLGLEWVPGSDEQAVNRSDRR